MWSLRLIQAAGFNEANSFLQNRKRSSQQQYLNLCPQYLCLQQRGQGERVSKMYTFQGLVNNNPSCHQKASLVDKLKM